MRNLAFYATFFTISILIVAAAIVERNKILLLLGMVLVGLTITFYKIEKKKGR